MHKCVIVVFLPQNRLFVCVIQNGNFRRISLRDSAVQGNAPFFFLYKGHILLITEIAVYAVPDLVDYNGAVKAGRYPGLSAVFQKAVVVQND